MDCHHHCPRCGKDFCHSCKGTEQIDEFRKLCPGCESQIIPGSRNDFKAAQATGGPSGRFTDAEKSSSDEATMSQRWPDDCFELVAEDEESLGRLRRSYSLACASAEDFSELQAMQ